MPAPLRICLTPEEDFTLSELRVATTVAQRTRERAHMLRLNAQGWTVGAIAEVFVCHEHTVRATIRRWQQQGLGGLWEAPGRGTKRKWVEADMQYLEQCLEQQERTYNSKQLATVLEQERAVSLSADRMEAYLAKKGVRWKRTRHSQQRKQDPQYKQLKQAQLDALKQVAQLGYIELMYLDESGCQLWSPASYSYSRVGEQKRIEQTDRRKGRISILGLWQPDKYNDINKQRTVCWWICHWVWIVVVDGSLFI